MRSDTIGFLYIVDLDRYYEYYRRGLRRIIPKRLMPVTRPRVLKQVYDSDEQVIGTVGGIFLKESNIKRDQVLEKLVRGIEVLKQSNTHNLILDELYLFNGDDIRYIENKTGLQVIRGRKVISAFIIPVLEEIHLNLGQELGDKEVLILGNCGELTKDIIETICTKVRFITLAGENNGSIENLIDEVFNSIGLSIFYSRKVEDILPNYSIIINLGEDISIDLNKIKERAIVFDFSLDNIVNKLMLDGSRPRAIEDFIFRCNPLSIGDIRWIEDLLPSYVYEYFYPKGSAEIEKLNIAGKLYDIEEYVSLYLRDRGKL
ncbi:MAG TPA: hypothetical protein GXX70_06555 [Tepidimicrobium sp.]|nr:hypothetical protein [Tepidimicrobium sp.]